jgi:hypothetical protein
MSATGGGKSSGSGYQTAATTLGNQAANTIGSQVGIRPGGAGMFGGILGGFGNNLGNAFASQPGQIPWNPRANRQPITTPEDQRELYDNAPPGVSIGGGPAPIDRGMPQPIIGQIGQPGGPMPMPSPGMPGGKSGPFRPFNPRDFTTPFNIGQQETTMQSNPPPNQFTPQFGAGSQMTSGPVGQPITNQPRPGYEGDAGNASIPYSYDANGNYIGN